MFSKMCDDVCMVLTVNKVGLHKLYNHETPQSIWKLINNQNIGVLV